ncbi:hypothetical protein PPERSA_10121 [Pseudocohnilembus persalinus]|uniref:Thioredoxin-like fold n=1 Tax=Pseudocohnilembus persalinus TaxID=266149 RepID=A0A0V0R0F8_PSEPJ|nr:hypothetical protein PPERSA_10121 [Pseudocohnilembus persalinus]|eukprot:KRX07837.1 hypothetical protein PPERSA_10121 [Pseudocohnilembus persalinus]
MILQNNMENLKKLGIPLIVIGSGSGKGGKLFASDASYPPEYVYANPDRKLYKGLKMREGKNIKDITNKEKKKRKQKRSTCCGLLYYFWNRLIRGEQGNIYQLGGTFLVDKNGKLLFEYRASFANDEFEHSEFIQNYLPEIIQKYKNEQNENDKNCKINQLQ